jgi:The GLUG motif.
VLTADITCTDKTWTPIGLSGYTYQGKFNGQGHSITGLSNADMTYSGYVVAIGLFGDVGGSAVIQNVAVKNCDLKLDSGSMVYAGAIAAANGGTAENCNCTGTVRVASEKSYVGGIVGANSGTVQNCYNTGTVEAACTDRHGTVYVGGVVGDNSGTVKNCYNTGTVSGGVAADVGGIVGYNSYGTVTNCLSVGAVSGGRNADVGGVVGWYLNNDSVTSYVEYCYFLDTTASEPIGDAGTATVTNVAALTAEQLQSLSNCVGFSTDTWYEGLSYPVLKALSAEVHLYANSNEDTVLQHFICAYVPTAFANPFTYADHTFTGWNTHADGDGTPTARTTRSCCCRATR